MTIDSKKTHVKLQEIKNILFFSELRSMNKKAAQELGLFGDTASEQIKNMKEYMEFEEKMVDSEIEQINNILKR